jgi:radical SAM superfamily enzyme YgiQ (UPF0313 family)
MYLEKKSGAADFAFFDDALLYRADELFFPFVESLARIPGNRRMHAPNGLHARWITGRIADAMFRTAFRTVRLGYESGDGRAAADTGNKAGRKKLREAVAILRSAGFTAAQIGVYVMAGLEGQGVREVLDEMGYVVSCGASVKPVFLSPVPGSALFERYAARFPVLRADPLWHNDLFFVTQLDGWSWEDAETVRRRARELNAHGG